MKITDRYQEVEPGSIYVAIKGENFNGEDFIHSAIQRGASCIIMQDEVEWDETIDDILYLYVTDARKHLATLCAMAYRAKPEVCVAVTGTNGKTSVTHFVEQISNLCGKCGAAIGTLGSITSDRDLIVMFDEKFKGNKLFTTLPPTILYKTISEMEDLGVKLIALEASSHGLEQRRLDGIKFDVAAFTNLTHDHMDYHHDMQSYFAAKLRLFTELMDINGYAVINIDDHYGAQLVDILKTLNRQIITYSVKNPADIMYQKSKQIIKIGDKEYKSNLDDWVEFQQYNILCAIGISIVSFDVIDLEYIVKKVIPRLKAASGRMELAAIHNDARIYVDYAHTPDALERVLSELRRRCDRKLYVVFGCGGDRDKAKRSIMGSIATRLADYVIVTDDNPRYEDPSTIRKEILASCPNGIEIPDRKSAIQYVVNELAKGDIAVIAGKGHEKSQIIGDVEHEYSDISAIKNAINM